ncbi:MAG: sodium-dependent transporter, partial [Thiovulaceae bacterium]|nr:sodium-dependent transporter [Sulfurimonadaceae bacterium]
MKIARFSRIGFILAASGSAVGLGNIWKFPYIAGENGGGAFVFVYLITVLIIGFSVMLAEMLIGYLGRRDSVSSFEALAPRNKGLWKYGGFMSLTGLIIMIFYSLVIGWIFHYIVLSFTALPSSVEVAKEAFDRLVSVDIATQLFYHTIVFVIVTAVVVRGIKGGIEKLNMILMPILFAIVGVMFLYATTLSGFSSAWHFMFTPDWSKLTSDSLVTAVGHAFFTLSLGMASILTYSASLPKGSSLVRSSLIVIALDTGIALLAGLMLFTFLFEHGAEPSAGPGLVFISLPAVFYEMGALGNFFSLIFFVALASAGLTSAVSLVEPMVQYLIDRFSLSRFKASLFSGLFFYLFGIIALLSMSKEYGELFTFGSRSFFDWADFITASVMLPLGGLLMAIFVGHVIEKERVAALLKRELGRIYPL